MGACSVTQSCPTLWDPLDCSPPGSSVLGILQARLLEWVAISFSRGSSLPRDWPCISCVSCIGRRILYRWATWEALPEVSGANAAQAFAKCSGFSLSVGSLLFSMLIPRPSNRRGRSCHWVWSSHSDPCFPPSPGTTLFYYRINIGTLHRHWMEWVFGAKTVTQLHRLSSSSEAQRQDSSPGVWTDHPKGQPPHCWGGTSSGGLAHSPEVTKLCIFRTLNLLRNLCQINNCRCIQRFSCMDIHHSITSGKLETCSTRD